MLTTQRPRHAPTVPLSFLFLSFFLPQVLTELERRVAAHVAAYPATRWAGRAARVARPARRGARGSCAGACEAHAKEVGAPQAAARGRTLALCPSGRSHLVPIAAGPLSPAAAPPFNALCPPVIERTSPSAAEPWAPCGTSNASFVPQKKWRPTRVGGCDGQSPLPPLPPPLQRANLARSHRPLPHPSLTLPHTLNLPHVLTSTVFGHVRPEAGPAVEEPTDSAHLLAGGHPDRNATGRTGRCRERGAGRARRSDARSLPACLPVRLAACTPPVLPVAAACHPRADAPSLRTGRLPGCN